MRAQRAKQRALDGGRGPRPISCVRDGHIAALSTELCLCGRSSRQQPRCARLQNRAATTRRIRAPVERFRLVSFSHSSLAMHNTADSRPATTPAVLVVPNVAVLIVVCFTTPIFVAVVVVTGVVAN